MRVSEIRVKQIRVNQGLGVLSKIIISLEEFATPSVIFHHTKNNYILTLIMAFIMIKVRNIGMYNIHFTAEGLPAAIRLLL